MTDESEGIGGSGPVVMWFRVDLRTADNAALHAAVLTGRPVACLYVLEESTPDTREAGGAKKWWLHHSLASHAARLRELGARLILRRGDAQSALREVIAATDADAVVWNRRYGKGETQTDSAIKAALKGDGIAVRSFPGHLLHEPRTFRTGSGGHYKVYTPFYRALVRDLDLGEPLPAPERIDGAGGNVASDELDDWRLLPAGPDWSRGIREFWTPGEAGAHERLDAFKHDALPGYANGRDLPAIDGTSRLSPHLALGEITPRQAFAITLADTGEAGEDDLETFRKEIAWRDFSYHLLHHYPDMPRRNIDRRFDAFPWADMDAEQKSKLRAWQRGRTGYPIVDAGMRQLWHIGWMHNRVRMITASFLIKHLLIDWRHGEEWFWDTLVDWDAANNSNGWQWVAGSGADAAPFFRVFNPILQGEKFDPDGEYVRRWVPELAKLPAKHIHAPWKAPDAALVRAGVRLGATYPEPIVDHAFGRQRALDAYREMREAA